eukprot:1890656-Rhodomonas_salina.1
MAQPGVQPACVFSLVSALFSLSPFGCQSHSPCFVPKYEPASPSFCFHVHAQPLPEKSGTQRVRMDDRIRSASAGVPAAPADACHPRGGLQAS